jgi:hypothetical protein
MCFLESVCFGRVQFGKFFFEKKEESTLSYICVDILGAYET